MNKRRSGFTLIELIGVLAIIAILASAIAPNIAREIQRAIVEAEDRTLETLTDALRRSVVEGHMVPGVNVGGWNAAIAPFLDLPAGSIVSNRGAGSRRLISRPTNDLGGVPYDQAARFSAGALPQGTLPSVSPLQARLLLVSNLNGAPPAAALTDVQFDAVWNQAGILPAGFTENDDLRIARCGLAASFHPITVNCLAVTNVPSWALDTGAVKGFLNTGSFTVYLIAGTRIRLLVGPVVQCTMVADRSRVITYDGTVWSF